MLKTHNWVISESHSADGVPSNVAGKVVLLIVTDYAEVVVEMVVDIETVGGRYIERPYEVPDVLGC